MTNKGNVAGTKNWPKDDRPREKLLRKGPGALSNSELLAILLRTGIEGTSAIDLARRIIEKFGTFRNMNHIDIREWKGLKGLGPAKIAQIQAALTTKGEREAQRALDGEYKKRRLVCVQDMGVGPGLTNIMAAYLMKQLDRIDTIDYNMITYDLVPPDKHTHPLLCPIPLSDLLYLYTKPTFVYEDGILKEIEPRARPIKFTFDPPIGEQTIAGVAHSEPVCLSKSFADKGIKRVITRTSYGQELDKKIEFLRDLGFWSQDPIDVKGQKVLPYDVLQALVDRLGPDQKTLPDFIADLVAVVMGKKDGVTVEYRLRAAISPDLHQKMKDKGCSGSYRAGVCAAAAAVLIGRGQVRVTGVVAPELAIPPELYFAELSKFGFKLELTRKSLL